MVIFEDERVVTGVRGLGIGGWVGTIFYASLTPGGPTERPSAKPNPTNPAPGLILLDIQFANVPEQFYRQATSTEIPKQVDIYVQMYDYAAGLYIPITGARNAKDPSQSGAQSNSIVIPTGATVNWVNPIRDFLVESEEVIEAMDFNFPGTCRFMDGMILTGQPGFVIFLDPSRSDDPTLSATLRWRATYIELID